MKIKTYFKNQKTILLLLECACLVMACYVLQSAWTYRAGWIAGMGACDCQPWEIMTPGGMP